MLQKKSEIWDMILSQKSKLDTLIPPEQIVSLLKARLNSTTSLVTRVYLKVRGIRREPHRFPENPGQLLRRVLVLRAFLGKAGS